MEKISRALFSMKFMTYAMILFLLGIGAATFIESAYDIQTAKILIYNALWFEVLLVYLAIILVANIFRYQMFSKEKIAMLVFHLSFILILIGAGITRFVSYEGLMLIREGQQSNFIYSSDPHLWFRINDGKMQYTYAEKLYMTEVKPLGMDLNSFSIPVSFPGHNSDIKIEYLGFQKKMIDSLVINDTIDGSVLEIMTNGMQSNYLEPGGFLMEGEVPISFDKKDAMPGIYLFKKEAKIMMKSKLPVRYLPMAQMQKYRQSGEEVPDSLFVEVPVDSVVQFQTLTLYQSGNEQFVFKQVVAHAKRMLLPSGRKDVGQDYLTVKITDGDQSKVVQLQGGMGMIPEHEMFTLNGLTYEMEYGSTRIELPFAIACRDFQLDRYPGSMAPSSFASEVTVIDEKKGFKKDYRIFMNNVLDYGGYRFFQSSYDPDELGTRLSVNHDWWGTNITYLGYLLMSIGMIMSLFAPVGRFRELNGLLKKSKEKREKMINVLILLIAFGFVSSPSIAQNEHEEKEDHQHEHQGNDHSAEEKTTVVKTPIYRVMSEEHSEELASLLVQDQDGRIIPMHTLCDQILRKVYRANKFNDLNAVQVVMSMHMYPDYWMDQKVINISSNLKESLKLKDGYASFRELADENGDFKLMKEYQVAHQKLESKRNEYDKKLIKLVERFQVMQAVFSWKFMKILPAKGAPNNQWFIPLSMEVMQYDTTSSTMALRYISGLDKASELNKFGEVADLLKDLKTYQREAGEKVVPSESKVNMEIRYNKMNIFGNSLKMYSLIGFILLIVFFVRIFLKPSYRSEKTVKRIGNVLVGLLAIVFIFHGFGLAMRWNISGHAPWSNGYEAVVFIAWVTMIAGFSFMRKNPVIIAGTAILAALMIFVTEMNLMDPEITPLQPVLKSYWLMIHVAIITGSYGFLGLGAILSFLNLTMYIFRNKNNGKLITLHINELSHVAEMTITIGLFMLTIGTFLGGIWANESWGRYWGWDPKETWALVSVLVYAVILHLRFIPALNGKFLFNLVSFWGYSAILFTFFGVNFYLVGLHSYAQGEGLGQFPLWLWITIGIFVLYSMLSYMKSREYKKKLSEYL